MDATRGHGGPSNGGLGEDVLRAGSAAPTPAIDPAMDLLALKAVTEIPRSATGKILQRVLKERPTG